MEILKIQPTTCARNGPEGSCQIVVENHLTLGINEHPLSNEARVACMRFQSISGWGITGSQLVTEKIWPRCILLILFLTILLCCKRMLFTGTKDVFVNDSLASSVCIHCIVRKRKVTIFPLNLIDFAIAGYE